MKYEVKEMKAALLSQLDEWLGSDIPEEGSEDYEAWKSQQQDIDAIESLADVYDYLGGEGERAKEFFEGFGMNDYKSKV